MSAVDARHRDALQRPAVRIADRPPTPLVQLVEHASHQAPP